MYNPLKDFELIDTKLINLHDLFDNAGYIEIAKEVDDIIESLRGISPEKVCEAWLKDIKHDGFNDGDECGCQLGDLMPCGEVDNIAEGHCTPYKEGK